MKLKFSIVLLLMLSFQFNFAQYTDVINSNRPGESMSAYAVGKKVLQLESGVNIIKEKSQALDYDATGYYVDLACRYGVIAEQLEFISSISYQNDTFISNISQGYNNSFERSGIKSFTVGGKYLLFDPFKNYTEKPNLYSYHANFKFNKHDLIPAVGLYVGAGFNLNSNKFIAVNEKLNFLNPKIMLVTQNIFRQGYIFVTNIFYDKITSEYKNFGYVATFTKTINKHWSGFLEHKLAIGSLNSDSILTGGSAFLISEDLQLDISISKNFKNSPSLLYAGIGISWRNDLNYKQVKYVKEKPLTKDEKAAKKLKEEKEKAEKADAKAKAKAKKLEEKNQKEFDKANPTKNIEKSNKRIDSVDLNAPVEKTAITEEKTEPQTDVIKSDKPEPDNNDKPTSKKAKSKKVKTKKSTSSL